jgi:hypothetical protein
MRGDWLDPTRSRATVAMLAGEWFEAQIQVKPTTRSGYRYSLDKHVLPKWGERRLTDVGHGEIQAWVNGLTESLGPSQARQVYLVLAGVMRFAIRDGRLLKNPCDRIQLPRLVKKRRGYLNLHKFAFLLRMRAFGRFSFLLGLCRSSVGRHDWHSSRTSRPVAPPSGHR